MNFASGKHALSLLQRGAGLSRSVTIGGGLSNLTRTMATARAVSRGGRKKKAPTMMDIAKAMPLSMKDLNNSELFSLGAMGNTEARREILVRHIMAVDHVSYDVASDIFMKIAAKNREGMWLLTIPYKIGIGIATTAAFASFPLVFDLTSVQWFNEHFVTADIPEPKDLETPLEVGSWAWNWMEPPLGQISFFLLCLQFTRAQIENIGIRPYTEKVMSMRAEKLARAFPRYNAQLVMDFSESITFYHYDHGIFGRRHF